MTSTSSIRTTSWPRLMANTIRRSAFLGADAPAATVTGGGEVFRATVAALD